VTEQEEFEFRLRLEREMQAAKAPPPAPAVVQIGQGLREIPRQAGLTLRGTVQGVAALPAMLSDAVTGVANAAADAYFERRAPTLGELVTGKQRGFRFQPAAYALGNLMTKAGVPEPANANERVVQDILQTGTAAGGLTVGAGKLAQGATGVTRNVLQSMAAKPAMQLGGAVGAAGAGGSVREAGGGPGEQFVAALVGGLAGGAAVDVAGKGRNLLAGMLKREPQRMQAADLQIQMALNRSGLDWSSVPDNIRRAVRTEVADALKYGGELDAKALNRLLVFKRAGVTPTVGQLTQNPGQITREMNLAKTGANSTDPGLQALPNLQNANTAKLLGNLDDMGAMKAADPINVSRAAIDDLDRADKAMRSYLGGLYDKARDSSGRSLQLNHGAFNQRVNQLLDDANVGSFLPSDIRNKINAMGEGKPGFELRIDAAEQLKSSMAKLSRNSTDGNVREALKLVRQALDETPLADSIRSNADNLPAVPGSVPPSTSGAGQAALDAFAKARSEYARYMARIEKTPSLKAVIDGIEPDQFLEKFLTSKSASVADVRAMRDAISKESAGAIRQALVKQLRDAATNSTDDITKFSGDAYRRALRNIGQEKLGVFFSKDELQMLRDVGDAAKYMQAQPAGSAVNNSNTAAMALGRAFDVLERVVGKVPLLKDTLQGSIQGVQQRASLAPSNALKAAARVEQAPAKVNPLIAAAAVSPAQSRENDRSN
jgi:hypothetical protein